jgi:integrase
MLYRREKYFHYDFTVAGKRFRGSTRQTSESRARKVESKLIAKAEQSGPSAVLRRAPLLSVFGSRFLSWVNDGRGLAANTRRYYRLGWQRIAETPLMGMTLDRITPEEVDGLLLSGSPRYVNQALRTLRRLLGKAVEWKVMAVAPRIRLLAEPERQQVLDPESEAKLVAVGKQPLNDVLVIIQDTGMRPDEVFRARIENIDFGRGGVAPHLPYSSVMTVGSARPNGRYSQVSYPTRASYSYLLRLRKHPVINENWLHCDRSSNGERRVLPIDLGVPKFRLTGTCNRHAAGTGLMSQCALVVQLQSELNLSRIVRSIASRPNLAKIRTLEVERSGDCSRAGAGGVEVGVVENVEEFRTELEAEAFCELEILEKRKVQPAKSRSGSLGCAAAQGIQARQGNAP